MEINRIIYKELASEISKQFISILIGPRQVGKTFLMRQLDDEVDFILLKNRVPVPVEVKYRLSKPVVPGGTGKFLQKYPDAPFALVFSKNAMGKVECYGRQVRFLKLSEAEDIEYLESVE